MFYNADNVFLHALFFFHSKFPSMFEQLCRKITDFPGLMTDFLPIKIHDVVCSIFLFFLMNEVQCKYKVTLGKINYFRVTPYKFKDEKRLTIQTKCSLQFTPVSLHRSVAKLGYRPQDTKAGWLIWL